MATVSETKEEVFMSKN